jgi:hypothetical protein
VACCFRRKELGTWGKWPRSWGPKEVLEDARVGLVDQVAGPIAPVEPWRTGGDANQGEHDRENMYSKATCQWMTRSIG